VQACRQVHGADHESGGSSGRRSASTTTGHAAQLRAIVPLASASAPATVQAWQRLGSADHVQQQRGSSAAGTTRRSSSGNGWRSAAAGRQRRPGAPGSMSPAVPLRTRRAVPLSGRGQSSSAAPGQRL
jgi:hypothetical protein